jgi:hypothetical protein
MRRALVAGLLSMALLLVPSVASASPMYWYDSAYTARHGWIVKAGNDSNIHTIRTTCRWYAGGDAWHLSWRIEPNHWYWTSSDAGNYGNFRPQGLNCSYVVLW